MGIEILFAAAAGLQALGQISAAQQRANQAETQARIQRIEAARANQSAREQRRIGEQESDRRERAGRAQRGASRAAIGASGVRLQGTPTDVLADQALENELNANLATFESQLRARELRRQEAASLTEANQLESRASAERTAGFFQAGSTLLSAGAGAAQRSGGFGGGGSGGLAGSGSGTNALGGPGGEGTIAPGG